MTAEDGEWENYNSEDFNSANFRKEWQMLGRLARGPRSTQFPEMSRLFAAGTDAEKRQVLERYLKSGSNLEACEGSFKMQRTAASQDDGVRELLTLREMRERNFSECRPQSQVKILLFLSVIVCHLCCFQLLLVVPFMLLCQDKDPGHHCPPWHS